MNTTQPLLFADYVAEPFDYAAVQPTDRDWLAASEAKLFSLRRNIQRDYIHMGHIFADARERLPRRQFKDWILRTANMSRGAVYRSMDVAKSFGEFILSQNGTVKISLNAMQRLSEPSVTPKAREAALEMIRGGCTVSAKDACAIISALRPVPNLTKEEVKDYEEKTRHIREQEAKNRVAPPAAPNAQIARESRAWRNLIDLVKTASVTLSTVDDAEDAELTTFFIRAIYTDDVKDDCRPRSCVRADPVDAVESMLGREEQKRCGTCYNRMLAAGHLPGDAERQSMRPVSWFVANRSKKDGLASECKSCSRPRVQEAKSRGRNPQAEAA